MDGQITNFYWFIYIIQKYPHFMSLVYTGSKLPLVCFPFFLDVLVLPPARPRLVKLSENFERSVWVTAAIRFTPTWALATAFNDGFCLNSWDGLTFGKLITSLVLVDWPWASESWDDRSGGVFSGVNLALGSYGLWDLGELKTSAFSLKVTDFFLLPPSFKSLDFFNLDLPPVKRRKK